MPKCTGHSSQTGKPCDAWAIKGGTVCVTHGGAAPAVKAKAQQRLQDQEAEEAVVLYGLPREVDPHTALLEELCRTAGHVAWLRDRIADLEEADRLHGPVGNPDHMMAEQPHIWLRIYQDERKHFAAVASACVKAGIEERRIKLAEQQAELIARVISGLLSDLGIDPRSDKARKAVRKNLTMIAGGAA